MGTHTSGAEPNYLMIADVSLPDDDANINVTSYNNQTQEYGGQAGDSATAPRIDVNVRILHDGEVNRARYCPKNHRFIATKTPTIKTGGLVYIFDYFKKSSEPSQDSVCEPLLKLKGHTKEGYGLAWNHKVEGLIASGSDDKRVCVWQIQQFPASPSANQVAPLVIYEDHESVVEDVAWHKNHDSILASVCDDKHLRLFDIRNKEPKPSQKIVAHKAEVNSVDFSPFSDHLFITSSADKTVKLWDMRNLKQELHALEGHTDEVFTVSWAPFQETILASCGADRRVMVWDISKIGETQTNEDAEDGPAELLFIHGGHTSKISDFSWNMNEQQEWVAASVAEDNILQVWQMAENIYLDDDDEKNIPDADLE